MKWNAFYIILHLFKNNTFRIYSLEYSCGIKWNHQNAFKNIAFSNVPLGIYTVLPLKSYQHLLTRRNTPYIPHILKKPTAIKFTSHIHTKMVCPCACAFVQRQSATSVSRTKIFFSQNLTIAGTERKMER